MPTDYTFVSGKTQLVDPNNGSFVDTWDQPVNSNFGVIDASVSGTTTVNLLANTTPANPFVTLTFPTFPTYAQPWTEPLAGQNLRLLLTGALAYNVIVYIPANVPGMWLVDNQTSNGFTVTILTNTSGSTGISPPQGYMSYVFCDGTNVYWADQGNVEAHKVQSIPPGTISAYGGPNIPSGWLYCNGTSYGTGAFPALFGAIGYTWGGSGGNFNVPNLVGWFIRGAGGNAPGLGQSQGDQFGSHNHGINDPGHQHQTALANIGTSGSPFGLGPVIAGFSGMGNVNYPTTLTNIQPTGISTQAAGGNETRPANQGVYYMIKT